MAVASLHPGSTALVSLVQQSCALLALSATVSASMFGAVSNADAAAGSNVSAVVTAKAVE